MNKFIFFILLSTIFYFNPKKSNSQDFSFTPLGSTFVQYPHIPDSIQIVKHRGIVRNNGTSTLHFRFARILNQMPNGWETQMCYDLCYAPFIDTISLPSDPPYSIPPGHIDTLFYIDYTCVGQGLGTAVVKMYNTDNPSQHVQITFKVQIGSVGINPISETAEGYSLYQNYPNPFNPVTKINFSLPKSENVSLKVYDALGNEVANLINNEKLVSGKYSIDFNAYGYEMKLSSGVYYYKLITDNFADTKKMILIK
ncbi:MAG: hypothetical protein HGGPFJEG_00231 [Ignavibacteria bacterium]|nr:hypothetical protein [Ignavibacteria bacterium]